MSFNVQPEADSDAKEMQILSLNCSGQSTGDWKVSVFDALYDKSLFAQVAG